MNEIQKQLKKVREEHDATLCSDMDLVQACVNAIDALAARVEAPPPREADAGKEDQWRYSHDEIEMACGGEIALMVRDYVMSRRARIAKETTQQPPPPAPAATERQEKSFEQWWDSIDDSHIGDDEKCLCRRAFAAGRESQWRDAAALVEQWRAQADQLNRDFPRYPKCDERAECLRHCADQLAALLPPIPKGEAS